MVLTDVQDANGNNLPDALVPRRFAIPLPDGRFVWDDEYQICDMNGDDFDLSTLRGYMYVIPTDAFSLPSVGFAHGFISEVVAVPASPGYPTPAVGDFVVHYEPSTFWIDDERAFVSLFNPDTSSVGTSYIARAVNV